MAWSNLIQQYSASRLATDAHWFKELFIDSTMIKNVPMWSGRSWSESNRQRTNVKGCHRRSHKKTIEDPITMGVPLGGVFKEGMAQTDSS
jgi:hypothetical protein